MIDRSQFSPKLLANETARSDEALGRIALAKKRIQSILDRDTVCNQKTLEQKISEQGPKPQRVDPHLVGLAIMDHIELNRLRSHEHSNSRWYANLGTRDALVQERLNVLGPLYAQIVGAGFGNLLGDALEIVVWKCLDSVYARNRRYPYQGHFETDEPKNQHGRYRRVQPAKTLNGKTSTGGADFLQFGYDAGPLCIECKNYREWLYPHHTMIKELIIKAAEIDAIPVLIARRLHYTTRSNLLEPAGIIAHESLFQYYPIQLAELAERVKHARLLGFTDVVASETPTLAPFDFSTNFFLSL